MSADPVTSIDLPEDGSVHCWCCGTIDAPDRMVNLGDHPEIEGEGKQGPAALVRDRFRDLRALVIRRGWHHNRFIGAKLRWLDRYLP